MSLLTSIIDLDSIHVDSVSAPFQPEDKATEIEALAHTIVELGGLIEIPLVRTVQIDEYELVSGHLEYYAFLKARELDSNLPDRITVFILKPKLERAMLKQHEVSQAVRRLESSHPSEPEVGSSSLDVSNLGSRIDVSSKQLAAAIQQLKSEIIAAIDAKLPQPLSPLEAFNRIDEPAVQEQVFRKLEFLNQRKARKIIERIHEHKKAHSKSEFKKFRDVLDILEKGTLSEKKMLEVIDRWN
jgi:hypothetical protein